MKRILVTGFNRGLGFVITEYLLKCGYFVIGCSRHENLYFSKNFSNNFIFKKLDLNKISSIIDLFLNDEDLKNYGLDGLVNNAAIAYDDLITNLNFDKLEEMFRVNVFSVFILIKYAIRNAILYNKKISIVNVSSISAHTGYKGLAMYAATKGAIEAFTKNCAREWGKLGIRCNCVVPGFMETDMSSGLSQEMKNKIYSRTSLGRPTKLEDVAALVEFLLSDRSETITGQAIKVDSGTI